MSNNEDNNAASAVSDAPAGAPAPANTESPKQPASREAPKKVQSRFYSRMGKTAGSSPKPAAAETPVFAEGVSPKDAVLLRDNLPVRATVDPSLASAPDREERDRPRRSDSDSGDRDRGRGDRRGGRDRDRGRGRGRDRDRDGDREHSRESRPERKFEDESPVHEEPQDMPEPVEPVATDFPESEDEEPSQRLRFEDVPDHQQASSVQEFRPSREKQFAHDAGRARKKKNEARISKPEPQPKVSGGGLLGWMKSIFTSDSNGPTSAREKTESDRRGRGDGKRSHSRGKGPGSRPRAQSGEGRDNREGGSGEGKHRRRRRRGGRNRRRGGSGGGSGGGGNRE